jgi:hypothetical protein
MTSSIEEAKEKKKKKDTIKSQSENQKEVDETKIASTTQERNSATAVSGSSGKRKESSTSTEIHRGEDNFEEDEKDNGKDTKETTVEQNNQTDVRAGKKEINTASNDLSSGPVVSVTKRTRPPYKYDPEKVTLRFLFANRDGLTVTVECKPSDTVGEVKGQLLSVWPEDLQSCSSGDQLRLICMGKGMLIPDTRTLQDCEVPVFKTHPTPVNVAVRPKANVADTSNIRKDSISRGGGPSRGTSNRTTEQSGQGCGCVIS